MCVVCNVSVRALCGYVECVGVWCVLVCCWCFVGVFGCVRCCVVVKCCTHSQDHVGVTFFAHFLMTKKQSGTLTFHDVCCSKPLTFSNGFMCFCFPSLFQALFETSSPT